MRNATNLQEDDNNLLYLYSNTLDMMIPKCVSGSSEEIELFLGCRNLKDMDFFTKSDPYVRVSFKQDFAQNEFAMIGKN